MIKTMPCFFFFFLLLSLRILRLLNLLNLLRSLRFLLLALGFLASCALACITGSGLAMAMVMVMAAGVAVAVAVLCSFFSLGWSVGGRCRSGVEVRVLGGVWLVGVSGRA
ncbi:uncharacterized protein K452DRAFT_72754 [Aplosporella prunicola CBS 121167]|uniref:Uncharacterized protein n=1 Tax=Aplosporella prunicola CBS 121167 TaxID=1176127 RepID=A0A6A6BS69_9PEZI|nr:uncharacterized protein K452DRAFT_72754 [Aplosporella prunicola CBS 121167]KAF2146926.1 hypothetical protein K452DRAFT_72754 [Aplosporella prunicola CBS 121167]